MYDLIKKIIDLTKWKKKLGSSLIYINNFCCQQLAYMHYLYESFSMNGNINNDSNINHRSTRFGKWIKVGKNC